MSQLAFNIWKEALLEAWYALEFSIRCSADNFGTGFQYWVDMQNYFRKLSDLELAVYDIDIRKLNAFSQEHLNGGN